jgi:hypothetical protein
MHMPSSFRFASIAAGVALTLLASTSHAQVTALDDKPFDLPLGTEWFTGGTAASIGSIGANKFVALDASEYVYQSFTVGAGGSYTVSFDAFGTGLAELFNSTTSGAPNYSSYAGVLASAGLAERVFLVRRQCAGVLPPVLLRHGQAGSADRQRGRDHGRTGART